MTIPANIQQAIQAYYAERATPDDVAALEAWFREDIAHVKIFAEHGMLEWQMLCEHEKQDAAAILASLREAEERAEPDWSLLHTPAFETKSKKIDERPITFRQLCSLAGYVAGKGLRTQAGVISSIAAVLLLGALLYISIIGFGPAPDSPDLANSSPNSPAASTPSTPSTPRGSDKSTPTVATLTASHNAQWAQGALAPGSPLHANQRLTLTAGFAEITTNRGAIAILEAPATIQLTDHDNALRLHAGKLVGICETESSKGFLVRTPHMDITDLSTRFGVDTSDSATQAHVFTGQIKVQTLPGPDRLSIMKLLQAGQAVVMDHRTSQLQNIQVQTQQFVQRIEPAYQTPSYVLAYWRFEDGAPGQPVAHTNADRDYSITATADTSPNANPLFAYGAEAAPRFTRDVAGSVIPQTGQPNLGALDDTRAGAAKAPNLYSRGSRADPAPTRAIEKHLPNQWTVEASVSPASLDGRQLYVGKTGDKNDIHLMLGIDDGRYVIEVVDQNGGVARVQSPHLAKSDQWYHLAATSDGQTLSLYGRSAQQRSFVLLGSSAVVGPMPGNTHEWSIGAARESLDAQALIDEVRISDQALEPSQFLFSYPQP